MKQMILPDYNNSIVNLMSSIRKYFDLDYEGNTLDIVDTLLKKNNPKNGGDGLYLFPKGSYTLGKAPYMEASVGVENIFKFLRVDYVWRLNYRNHPDIQTKGIRCTMRLSF